VCAPCSGAHLRADIHSHRAPAGATDAVRLGLRRQAHQRPDAEDLHRLSAAARGSESEAASAAKAQSGRTAAGAAHALRLALPREAHRHEDAEALRSMPATAEGFCGRRVPVGVRGEHGDVWFAESGWIGQRFLSLGQRLKKGGQASGGREGVRRSGSVLFWIPRCPVCGVLQRASRGLTEPPAAQ